MLDRSLRFGAEPTGSKTNILRGRQKFSAAMAAPFFTSEAVLCEVGFMTGRAAEILEAVSKGHFIIGVGLEHDSIAMARILNKFAHCDRADSSIVALSEKLPDLDVITIDRRHFVTHRRADKSALPLVLPE